MKRLTRILASALLAGLLCAPAAQAFGLKELEVEILDAAGEASPEAMQAGSHPASLRTTFGIETEVDPEVGEVPAGLLRNTAGELPVGLTGSPFATPRCEGVDFATIVDVGGIEQPECSDGSVVGRVLIDATLADNSTVTVGNPVYNLIPPPGVALKLGFLPFKSAPVTVEFKVKDTPPYNVTFSSTNASQMARILGIELTVWGNPSDPIHDEERARCGAFFKHGLESAEPGGSCPTESSLPFLTLPRSCSGPLPFSFRALSWEGESYAGTTTTALGAGGCDRLGFGPEIAAAPTSTDAQSPTGLDFNLRIDDPGLTAPEGIADSDIKKAVVTLPEGMTINPSQAEGLGVCGEADFDRESAGSAFGAGCPAASKIGTTEVRTPLLGDKLLRGSLFVAEPYRNPFGTLIALYMTFKEPALGIGIKIAGKVEPDPLTGQLRATFDDLPQQPFSEFHLRFREGGRSPLLTPPACGTYRTEALFSPWADPANTHQAGSSFEIGRGVGGGPCPSGDAPFHPGFEAGTLNNAAGSYSPFVMRIARGDGEQDITRFSSVLPPGVLARLAGIPWCPEAGIAQAGSRTGEQGGTQELADPSCPAASAIGTTLAGAGAGSQLTYVPGTLYLAGPYNGAPLSVVAITPAVAGPFDAGTVVVREALRLNPVSGLAEVDGAASDPIPHILQGIPLNLRELRVDVERPDFTLNATSCAESQAKATLWGGGTVLAPTPDSPVDLFSRYQAAGCASLAFKPRLGIRLYGGTRRGAHPALRAIVRPHPGQANFARAAVTLPRSAFLDQGHIRTICTRVQFAAGAGHGSGCPAGAVYGHAKAWSPLLDGPATGPVYLRSSNNKLPDMVVALKGPDSAPVDVELASRIDSVKGGIRSIFTGIPDVPVSRFVLAMQGGKKGLIVNSRNLCYKPKRNGARANLLGQNGRKQLTKPRVVSVKCAKRRKAQRARAKRSDGHVSRASRANPSAPARAPFSRPARS